MLGLPVGARRCRLSRSPTLLGVLDLVVAERVVGRPRPGPRPASCRRLGRRRPRARSRRGSARRRRRRPRARSAIRSRTSQRRAVRSGAPEPRGGGATTGRMPVAEVSDCRPQLDQAGLELGPERRHRVGTARRGPWRAPSRSRPRDAAAPPAARASRAAAAR